MKIEINKQTFETNPTGMNEALVFKGTVHSGTGLQENVYGFTENHVIELAEELRKLNKDFTVVHIYSPYDMDLKRKYVGVKLLLK